jgi:hypothetical protein
VGHALILLLVPLAHILLFLVVVVVLLLDVIRLVLVCL